MEIVRRPPQRLHTLLMSSPARTSPPRARPMATAHMTMMGHRPRPSAARARSSSTLGRITLVRQRRRARTRTLRIRTRTRSTWTPTPHIRRRTRPTQSSTHRSLRPMLCTRYRAQHPTPRRSQHCAHRTTQARPMGSPTWCAVSLPPQPPPQTPTPRPSAAAPTALRLSMGLWRKARQRRAWHPVPSAGSAASAGRAVGECRLSTRRRLRSRRALPMVLTVLLMLSVVLVVVVRPRLLLAMAIVAHMAVRRALVDVVWPMWAVLALPLAVAVTVVPPQALPPARATARRRVVGWTSRWCHLSPRAVAAAAARARARICPPRCRSALPRPLLPLLLLRKQSPRQPVLRAALAPPPQALAGPGAGAQGAAAAVAGPAGRLEVGWRTACPPSRQVFQVSPVEPSRPRLSMLPPPPPRAHLRSRLVSRLLPLVRGGRGRQSRAVRRLPPSLPLHPPPQPPTVLPSPVQPRPQQPRPPRPLRAPPNRRTPPRAPMALVPR